MIFKARSQQLTVSLRFAFSQSHRFNNNNILFYSDPLFKYEPLLSIAFACTVLLVCDLAVIHLLMCTTYLLQETQRKNRTQFDFVDTVVFPSERTGMTARKL